MISDRWYYTFLTDCIPAVLGEALTRLRRCKADGTLRTSIPNFRCGRCIFRKLWR